MSRSRAAWGLPDFGQMLERNRIVQRIAESGDRPCVLFGPSGCGKSVAAAQYASASGRRAVWIDAGGEFQSARQLAHTVRRALHGDNPNFSEPRRSDGLSIEDLVDTIARSNHSATGRAEGVLVIADDLGAPPTSQSVTDLRMLAKGLWRNGSRILVTCRGLSEWSSDVLRDCVLIGHGELALTSEEAGAYLERGGFTSLLDQGDELRAACGGHPAFFAVMASQASEHGLATRVARTPSLEAWLRNAIVDEFTGDEQQAVVAATLLRVGDETDLARMGVNDPIQMIDSVATAMPLVGCARTLAGGRSFRVHQLLDGFLVDAGGESGLAVGPTLIADAVALLSARGDYARAAELLGREGDAARVVSWLEGAGEEALAEGHYESLGRLIRSTPVAALMARPQLLLIWAEVCAETGRLDDAFAKCRAARALAEHDGDSRIAYRALALCARYAGRANRLDEAESLASEILDAPLGQVDEVVLAEAMVCRAQNAVMRAHFDQAEQLLRDAIALSSSHPRGEKMARSASQALYLVPALAKGDYLASSRMLAPAIVEGQQYLTDRVMLKGNVATCLCEAGRLPRCEQLLRSALGESQSAGLDVYTGAYLAVMGCAKAGGGDSAHGIELIRQGIATSLRGGDEQGADQSRVGLAMALRATGECSESLVVAERAFERLTIADTCHFRRLAALEVAASLLALGDLSAAASWAGAVADAGLDGNRYHSLRAQMVLAEVDRRQGHIQDAIGRICGESEYILSENPNWQIAMYCRAFPGLLGVFASALGVQELPLHLLRMIPTEAAERILIETSGFLAPVLWQALGERLLGEAEMNRHLARGGLPLCHVRLFGGLEVSIGGRTVRERDWRKRKARLLFAMLAIRRGRDVPRDQVIEYLWPEMDEDRAKNNLYVAWSTMKSVLGGPNEKGRPSPYVECVGGVCRTVHDTVRSDIDEFEEAIVVAREAESASRDKDALSAYERIASLYRGELLPGDVYDDWFTSTRDHYRSEFVDAMLRASQLLADSRDPGNALIYIRRAIQTDPVREDLYQRALRCQIAAGQRSSAIETYLQCRDKLAEELGLDPSVETRELYDQILAMENRPVSIPLDPLVDS